MGILLNVEDFGDLGRDLQQATSEGACSVQELIRDAVRAIHPYDDTKIA